MAISNISGTTMPSFKLKTNGGIELISAAIKNEEGKVVSTKFKVKTISSGVEKIQEVAYYDTHIASEEIRCLQYINNGLKIILRDGKEILLDNLIRKDAITFDVEDEYEEGRIVVIGKTGDGATQLKGSKYKIAETYNPEKEEENLIPTVQATKSIAENVVKTASVGLIERVNGDNVTLI